MRVIKFQNYEFYYIIPQVMRINRYTRTYYIHE